MNIEKAVAALQKWMDEEGLLPSALADKAGISRSTVSLLFRGQRKASAELLGELAEALGHERNEILVIAEISDPVAASKDPWVIETQRKISKLSPEFRKTIDVVIEALYKSEKKGTGRGKR